MATGKNREQDKRRYLIRGLVVDRATQRGVRGLRVEAWDRDTRYHDLLGQVTTDENGRFTIGFDSDYFGDYGSDVAPDVFYKVFMDQRQVLTTFDEPQRNLQAGTSEVKLEIDLPQLQPLGKDRVSTEQMFKILDWWQASDFRGVYRETSAKTMTVGKFTGTVFGEALKNWDFAPVQPKGPRESEIVGQNQEQARVALAQQQVEVSDVRPVPSLSQTGNLKSIAGYPARLNAGDRVTLYADEQGTVKYYTLDAKPDSADQQALTRIDGDVQAVKARVLVIDDLQAQLVQVKSANAEVAARAADDAAAAQANADELARVKSQLADVQQASADKDVQIAKLQSDLALVRQAQDNLATQTGADRIHALELAVQKLGATRTPAVKKATSKTATKAAAKPKGRG